MLASIAKFAQIYIDRAVETSDTILVPGQFLGHRSNLLHRPKARNRTGTAAPVGLHKKFRVSIQTGADLRGQISPPDAPGAANKRRLPRELRGLEIIEVQITPHYILLHVHREHLGHFLEVTDREDRRDIDRHHPLLIALNHHLRNLRDAPAQLLLVRHPVVLDAVLASVREESGDRVPFRPKFPELLLEEAVLGGRPGELRNRRIDVVVPALAALPCVSALDVGGNLGPVLAADPVDDL